MSPVDYDQVARFEAASELLNSVWAICIVLEREEPKYAERLEEKQREIRSIERALRTKDDEMVKKVRDVFGPIAREYYSNPTDFKLTEAFFDAKLI